MDGISFPVDFLAGSPGPAPRFSGGAFFRGTAFFLAGFLAGDLFGARLGAALAGRFFSRFRMPKSKLFPPEA
jgi:hypothetical protein